MALNKKIAVINMPIENWEVPELRKSVGWQGGPEDYPSLFERCNYWAGIRNESGKLIAFGYVCGTGIVHGYMEDIIVHPDYHGQGLGKILVRSLLGEAKNHNLEIITVSFEPQNADFYVRCGFALTGGGVYYQGKIEEEETK